jgi:DNA-directed RNA polymerase subunit K/omega
MPKPKTLYSNKKNVDANLMLKTDVTTKNNIQAGGGSTSKRGKKSKKEDSESEYGSESEDEVSDEEESDEDDDNEDEQENEEQVGDEQDDEEGEEGEEAEESEESDEESDNKSTKSNESEEYKDEEKKCYSKYAIPDADDIDLDELFADDDFKMKKTSKLTKPVLFKYEKVRLLSIRAKQLAQGAKPMIKETVGLSSKEIALLELKEKVIPLIIERPVPNSGVERWKLSELEIPE